MSSPHSPHGRGAHSSMSPGRQQHSATASRRQHSQPHGGHGQSHGQSQGQGKQAIRIDGCKGKFGIVNGVYEPSSSKYNNQSCWVNRSTKPVYLFHTRKARWVVGKRLDDGQCCYAFVADSGGQCSTSPVYCQEQWMTGSDEGEWKPDPGMYLTAVPASEDPFVKIRVQLEDEMRRLNIMDETPLKQLWKKLDANGDNEVDLLEVDTLVEDLTKTGVWPSYMNDKIALERAFHKTVEESEDGDDKIEKEEFHDLLLNIFWFTKLAEVFGRIDSSGDSRLDVNEFAKGLETLGVKLSRHEAETEFNQLDADRSRSLDFGEFCLFVRKKVCPDANPNFDGDSATASKNTDAMRKKGNDSTQGCILRKKQMADFDKLEQKIKKILKDNDQKELKKMWKNLDFNGNNVVSLAEIDKWIKERYPILNHAPALIRAQQATLAEGDGDDWVEKKEFKLLVANVFYYNKLFWLFDQCDEDKDRRMTLKEFQWCLTMAGLKLSEAKAKAEFDKCNSDGGDLILFEEFCKYFVSRQCPEAYNDFIGDE